MVTAIRVLGCQRSYRAPWNPAFHSLTLTFILTLICPASRWTQWVTTQREQLTVLLPSSVPSSVGLSQSHCRGRLGGAAVRASDFRSSALNVYYRADTKQSVSSAWCCLTSSVTFIYSRPTYIVYLSQHGVYVLDKQSICNIPDNNVRRQSQQCRQSLKHKLKRCFLSLRLNEYKLSASRTAAGRLFHTTGPATEKALSPKPKFKLR